MDVPIECKNCQRRYVFRIPSNNNVNVFAAICDCGEIFAGNYQDLSSSHDITSKDDLRNFYTNGTFQILSESGDFPILLSE